MRGAIDCSGGGPAGLGARDAVRCVPGGSMRPFALLITVPAAQIPRTLQFKYAPEIVAIGVL
jgi:hypothetical protein